MVPPFGGEIEVAHGARARLVVKGRAKGVHHVYRTRRKASHTQLTHLMCGERRGDES